MYVITFYSFKGGVGRTLGLVNVATELARLGRRVLLVDFDLEAPGIETFDLLKSGSSHPTQGVVDYVTHYLHTGEAPNVTDYIYEPKGAEGSAGKLWIMPAGKQDKGYGYRLNSINWKDLYENHDGYLMVEDLKEQWRTVLVPDYVLIDSRTGHTDVGGICTRQLPDAVGVFFFPNQQNLNGLKKVVEDIRNEARSPRSKSVHLHFVMSNVPDIDDEENILEHWTSIFKEELGYQEPAGVIHHYNSLSLLDQVVFTSTRERSRLASEYRAVVSALIRHNPEDRAGVLSFLQEVNKKADTSASHMGISATVLEDRLQIILNVHSKDGEVLYRLATLRHRQGRIDEALALITESIACGYRKSRAFLRRADWNSIIGNKEAAPSDILEALNSTDLNYIEASRAIRKLWDIDPKALEKVAGSPALKALDPVDLYQLAVDLSWSKESLAVAEKLLRGLINSQGDLKDSFVLRPHLPNSLGLCLIGLGRYKEAMEMIDSPRKNLETSQISSTFNYAMAEWAGTGTVPRDLFERVIVIHEQGSSERQDPNYKQCIAIAFWAVGRLADAREYLQKAKQAIMARPDSVLSGWRYLIVNPSEFLKDISSQESALSAGEINCPLIAKEASQASLNL